MVIAITICGSWLVYSPSEIAVFVWQSFHFKISFWIMQNTWTGHYIRTFKVQYLLIYHAREPDKLTRLWSTGPGECSSLRFGLRSLRQPIVSPTSLCTPTSSCSISSNLAFVFSRFSLDEFIRPYTTWLLDVGEVTDRRWRNNPIRWWNYLAKRPVAIQFKYIVNTCGSLTVFVSYSWAQQHQWHPVWATWNDTTLICRLRVNLLNKQRHLRKNSTVFPL